MTGFKPQTSGIESNRSTNSDTTTALKTSIFSLHLKINQKLGQKRHLKNDPIRGLFNEPKLQSKLVCFV